MGEPFPFRPEEAVLLNSKIMSTRKKIFFSFENLYHINITQENEKLPQPKENPAFNLK